MVDKGYIEIELRGKSLGRFHNARQRIYEKLSSTNSVSNFIYCGHCGEMWAKIILEHGAGWIAACRPCKKHGGSESILRSYPVLQELDDIPEALIMHEMKDVNKNGYDIWRAM